MNRDLCESETCIWSVKIGQLQKKNQLNIDKLCQLQKKKLTLSVRGLTSDVLCRSPHRKNLKNITAVDP